MIELPLVPFSRAKPGEEMKRGWVWGVGWLGVFVVEAGKEKSQMPVARPGWAPGGRGTRGTASGSSPAHPSGFIPSQWVHPIPWGPSHPLGSVPRHGSCRNAPARVAGPGEGGSAILHISCLKWWLPPCLPPQHACTHGEGRDRGSPPHARAPGTGAKMELEAEIKGGEGGEAGEDAPRLATA